MKVHKRVFLNTGCEMIDLFDKDKNFIEDSILIRIADEIENIIQMHYPYSHIQKLPELADKFKILHQRILDEEKESIMQDISDNLIEVKDELNSLKLEDKFGV